MKDGYCVDCHQFTTITKYGFCAACEPGPPCSNCKLAVAEHKNGLCDECLLKEFQPA